VSTGEIPEVAVGDQEFAQIWAEATSRVLESLHGKPFTATPRPPAAAETVVAASGESLWTRFTASGPVAGEFAFQFTRPDGVRLAQLLAGEPMDGSAGFNETHADALQEIFRQFAGVAATLSWSCSGAESRIGSPPVTWPGFSPRRKSLRSSGHWFWAWSCAFRSHRLGSHSQPNRKQRFRLRAPQQPMSRLCP